MARKRAVYGTSPPSANDRYAMDWDTALKNFMAKHWSEMGQSQFEAMYDYPWYGFSIAGLWSYRGYIWKKYEGKYPTPEEVGLPADHTFFDPDYVCYSRTIDASGVIRNEEWHHHGRLMRPSHRLWASRPRPTLKVGASRHRPTTDRG